LAALFAGTFSAGMLLLAKPELQKFQRTFLLPPRTPKQVSNTCSAPCSAFQPHEKPLLAPAMHI
jgi:hypothetical protein